MSNFSGTINTNGGDIIINFNESVDSETSEIKEEETYDSMDTHSEEIQDELAKH